MRSLCVFFMLSLSTLAVALEAQQQEIAHHDSMWVSPKVMTVDYALVGVSSVLIAADWAMTMNGIEQHKLKESNPILGPSPSKGRANLFIGAALVGNVALLKIHDAQLRRYVWIAVTLIEADALHTNFSSGLHLSFRF